MKEVELEFGSFAEALLKPFRDRKANIGLLFQCEMASGQGKSNASPVN